MNLSRERRRAATYRRIVSPDSGASDSERAQAAAKLRAIGESTSAHRATVEPEPRRNDPAPAAGRRSPWTPPPAQFTRAHLDHGWREEPDSPGTWTRAIYTAGRFGAVNPCPNGSGWGYHTQRQVGIAFILGPDGGWGTWHSCYEQGWPTPKEAMDACDAALEEMP